jgi:CubicO group peptidase (beta-lactamase class C family)
MQSDPAESLNKLFQRALADRLFSAASLAVASPRATLLELCWGKTHQAGQPVDRKTRFDLASLTKPLVTASLCMWAVSNGRLDLESRLLDFFPKASLQPGKRDVSIRHILNHSSGLPAYLPFYTDLIRIEPSHRREALVQLILQSPTHAQPGSVSQYSDLGFMLLGVLLEELLGAPLDTLASSILSASLLAPELRYRPLTVGMDPTAIPSEASGGQRMYVATENCPWRRRLLIGEVHDENAYCLGSVAGHAGLFGTAADIVQRLTPLWALHREESRIPSWSSRTVREFWDRPQSAPAGTWALGFDTPHPVASSAGRFISPHSVGHLGFTGTSFWLDLEKDLLVVLLTNRVYPSRNKDGIKAFRPMVHDLVMKGFHAG